MSHIDNLPDSDVEHKIIELLAGAELATDENRQKILTRLKEIRNYIPKVGILGKTGAGKSSLCNALFGEDVSEVSDIEACTREPKEFMLSLSQENAGLILVDMPGIGESRDLDASYAALYKSLLPEFDILLWVLKADDRAYAIDEQIHAELLAASSETAGKLIFVINQVDRLNPVKEWDSERNSPGSEQLELIKRRITHVSKTFNVEANLVCAVSASEKFGLGNLVEKIVTTVPNEKKFGFVREAKKESVTPKAKEEAEQGVWQAIKDGWDTLSEKTGEFYTKHKDTIHSVVGALFAAWLSSQESKKKK